MVQRWRRVATGLATALLAAAAVAGSASPAAADTAPNSTPATAVGFASVPYEDYGAGFADNPAATDPAAQRVAPAACNGGAGIYGTSWWKYTASSQSTFVVHAASAVGGPSVQEPIGMAVVAADLNSVLKCGTEGTSISDAGAFSRSAGGSLYIVTYFAVPTDNTPAPPMIGVEVRPAPVSCRPTTTTPQLARSQRSRSRPPRTPPLRLARPSSLSATASSVSGPASGISVTVPRCSATRRRRQQRLRCDDRGRIVPRGRPVDDTGTATGPTGFSSSPNAGRHLSDRPLRRGRGPQLRPSDHHRRPGARGSSGPAEHRIDRTGQQEDRRRVPLGAGSVLRHDCDRGSHRDDQPGVQAPDPQPDLHRLHCRLHGQVGHVDGGGAAVGLQVHHRPGESHRVGQRYCNSGGCTAATATANVKLKAS